MSEIRHLIKDLEAAIEDARLRWNVPGMAVGILKDGELLSARGYGVREQGKPEPVDAETNFAIGSNSKAFTAACIGLLVEEGRLAWDDKVVQYLPDFAVYDPWITREVTIRDILSHRIGVCDVERFLYNTTYSSAEVVRRFRHVQPSSPFRADFHYSNISFMAAGEIIEALTGESWETMVHARLFQPLGMQRSTTNFEDVQPMQNIALPHVNHYTGLLSMRARMLEPVQPIAWYPFGSQAAGGITSNVMDMAKWLNCWLGGGVYQGRTILKPETVSAMTSPSHIIHRPMVSMPSLAILKPEVNFWMYGLGWFVLDYKGHKLVLHGGQVQGMISVTAFLPQENLALVILTNINLSLVQVAVCLTILDVFLGGSRRDWSSECLSLLRGLRQSEEQQVQALESSRKKECPPSLSLEAYAGTYDHDYFGEHTVSREGENLILYFAPRNTADLRHWQEDTFSVHWRGDPFEGDFLTFSIESGRVNGFTLQKEGFFRRI